MNEINIYGILKYKPKGANLYSLMFGDVKLAIFLITSIVRNSLLVGMTTMERQTLKQSNESYSKILRCEI